MMSHLTGRRILRFGWLIAVLVVVGAHTPWIALRVPRFTLPVLATAGAVLIVLSLMNSLIHFTRHGAEGLVRFVRVLVNVVALVVLVLLPLTHLVRAVTPVAGGAPRIHSGFGDWLG